MNPDTLIFAATRGSAEGPDITWAGPNPFSPGLCLGFDDGSLMFSVTATGQTTRFPQISPATEAVNGVAGVGAESLAVSTRSDVTFIQFENGKGLAAAVFPGGAHGVIATRSGYFVAPLGPKGLLMVKPTNAPVQPMRVTQGTEGQLYFYRMVALDDGNGRETLASANRRGGVGLSVFDGGDQRRNVHTMGFDGIDVVDVCAVTPGSLSAVAISRGGEVLWIKDTSKRDNPIATRLKGVDGPVYRVLATARHLFVLSNKALYVWSNLVERVLFGKAVPESLPLVMPMDAADMSLLDEQYLLLVMGTNSITSLAISDLEKQPAEASPSAPRFSLEMSQRTGLENLAPKWRTADVEQRVMAGVA